MKTDIVEKLDSLSPQFVVSNLEASIRFYTEKLGFSLSFNYEDFYAGIDCNGHLLHLKLGEVSTQERQHKRACGHVDITFGVFDIKQVYEEVCKQNVEIIQPLRVMSYGTEFYIADPDGYLIAFFWSA